MPSTAGKGLVHHDAIYFIVLNILYHALNIGMRARTLSRLVMPAGPELNIPPCHMLQWVTILRYIQLINMLNQAIGNLYRKNCSLAPEVVEALKLAVGKEQSTTDIYVVIVVSSVPLSSVIVKATP